VKFGITSHYFQFDGDEPTQEEARLAIVDAMAREHGTMRKGDLEFLDNTDKDRSAEIIGWSEDARGPYCWTICWFKKDSEGYNLESVGSRMVSEDINQEDFMALVKYAFAVLNAKFELEKN